MNNNSDPNDNDRNAAAVGEDQPDSLSAFATAEAGSYPRAENSTNDGGLEAVNVPSTDAARVVLVRNGGGRRGSSIF